jgi:hypothetical protein
MKVLQIDNVKFGNAYSLDFYNLPHDDKIDVVYDVLQEQNKLLARIAQKQVIHDDYFRTLSENQNKIQSTNKVYQCLCTKSSNVAQEQLNDVYDKCSVDVIA